MTSEFHSDVLDRGLEQVSNDANWGGGVLTMALCVGIPATATEASTLYPTGKRIGSAIAMAPGDFVLGDKLNGREVTVATKSGVVDALINTLIDSGVAESVAASTLTDTDQAWGIDVHAGKILKIVGGTGSGQQSVILSNTANTVTVSESWGTQPDATSQYEIRQNMTLVLYDGGTARVLMIVDDTNDQTMDVLGNPINVPTFKFGFNQPTV